MLTGKREFDYIVVGSGAGGGPVAANLAEAGHEVLLIEAGGENEPLNYQVPAWHPNATEDPELQWDYFCRHYSQNPERDPKNKGGRLGKDNYDAPDLGGIYYPRSGTLGGCTAHHALITVYPHRADWENVARVTGDESWRADNMRQYFERAVRSQLNNTTDLLVSLDPRGKLERLWEWFVDLFRGKPGDDGWLPVNQADLKLVLGDKQLLKLIVSVIARAKKEGLKLMPRLNPNTPSVERNNSEGINLMPISTDDYRRTGTRERINAVRNAEGSTLTVQTNTLVTRVLFDDGEPPRALGVHCRHGEHLYEADPKYREPGFQAQYEEVSFRARREVILAGGAFNTPQLLMLSGIGDPDKLAAHHIEVRAPLPGVGRNLQDRYEVGVVYELAEDHKIIEGAEFGRKENGRVVEDRHLADWRSGEGVYTTNGALLGIIKKSRPEKTEPDLYIFGVPGYFEGYYVGYSKLGTVKKNRFTWAVLKGHTENQAGEVNLRSADPAAMPDIQFNYFDEGSGDWKEDADSVVAGVEFVDRIMQSDAVKRRLIPGEEYRGELRRYVTDNAWGHHASCTCKMGKDPDGEEQAVVDGKFRVHKTQGLRVVDASVFPRIPGLFILASVYIVSEKASDAILEDSALWD